MKSLSSPNLAKSKIKSWVSRTRGLGKQVWEKVDVRRYINDLRNEWENCVSQRQTPKAGKGN